MFSTTMINTTLDWERRLEIEEQNRSQHRREDVFTSESRFVGEEKNALSKIFSGIFNNKPVQTPYNSCCYESQHKVLLG